MDRLTGGFELRRLAGAGAARGRRAAGRTRLYRLNPRHFAREELENYLRRLAGVETEMAERTAQLRRRLRRAGELPSRSQGRPHRN